MSRVGVKDVARAAGVSVGTVSNVLNRPEIVRDDTRARVQAEMARLGFVRNESARQLRQGRSRTLAYVFLDATNPFFTDVARGAEAAAEQAGLALFLCNSNGDPAREDRYPSHCDIVVSAATDEITTIGGNVDPTPGIVGAKSWVWRDGALLNARKPTQRVFVVISSTLP